MISRRLKYLIGALILTLIIAGYFIFPQWVEPFHVQLISSDHRIRNLAWAQLNGLDENEKNELISRLIPKGTTNDDASRRFALYILRRLGAQGEEYHRVLLDALMDPSRGVRKEAEIAVLTQPYEVQKKVISEIHRYPDQTGVYLRRSFPYLGDSFIPSLIDLIENGDSQTKINAIEIVMEMDSTRALPVLVSQLSHDSLDVRYKSSLAINKLNPENRKVIPVFKEVLYSTYSDLQKGRVLEAVARMGKKGRSLKKILTEQLLVAEDGFEGGFYLRPAIAQTLNDIDPRGEDLTALSWDLKHKRVNIRYRAAWRISTMDPPNRGLIPFLVSSLQDPDSLTAARSTLSINKIGINKAKRFHSEVIPQLLFLYRQDQMGDSIPGFQKLIAETLKPLGSRLIPYAMSSLQQKEIHKGMVIELIKNLSPADIEPLRPYLEYQNSDVKAVARYFLDVQ